MLQRLLFYWEDEPPTGFYDLALRDGWPLDLEHAILIAAGLGFWWSLLEPPPRRLTVGPTLAYLGIAFMTSPWLSLALIFTTTPLYSFYTHVPRLWACRPVRTRTTPAFS